MKRLIVFLLNDNDSCLRWINDCEEKEIVPDGTSNRVSDLIDALECNDHYEIKTLAKLLNHDMNALLEHKLSSKTVEKWAEDEIKVDLDRKSVV